MLSGGVDGDIMGMFKRKPLNMSKIANIDTNIGIRRCHLFLMLSGSINLQKTAIVIMGTVPSPNISIIMRASRVVA